MTDLQLSISDEAFRYLAIQRGDINELSDDREQWERAYQASLLRTFASVQPFLPERAPRILDIGSGLGGIDVLLNRHYGGSVEVCPLDGRDDPALVVEHARTFNSEKATRSFLNSNGVTRVNYFAANALPPPKPFNLIVSFASWCFHYPPVAYLRFAQECLRPGGRLIVDMRRERPEWRKQLEARFHFVACAERGKKFDRLVYAG